MVDSEYRISIDLDIRWGIHRKRRGNFMKTRGNDLQFMVEFPHSVVCLQEGANLEYMIS